MSAIITITNQKGGVGKTTTACSLMDGLCQRGARVLGVDLDPQGSLGFCLGLDIENCATIYDVLKGTRPIRDVITPSDSCGDVLPSNILLSAAELEFNRPGREFLLKNALACLLATVLPVLLRLIRSLPGMPGCAGLRCVLSCLISASSI